MGNSGAGRREEKEKTEKKPVSGSKKEKRKLEGEKTSLPLLSFTTFFSRLLFLLPSLSPLSRTSSHSHAQVSSRDRERRRGCRRSCRCRSRCGCSSDRSRGSSRGRGKGGGRRGQLFRVAGAPVPRWRRRQWRRESEHEQRQRRWRHASMHAGFGGGERRWQESGSFVVVGSGSFLFLFFSLLPYKRFGLSSSLSPPSASALVHSSQPLEQPSSISAVFLNPSSPPGGPSQLRRVRLFEYLDFSVWFFFFKP